MQQTDKGIEMGPGEGLTVPMPPKLPAGVKISKRDQIVHDMVQLRRDAADNGQFAEVAELTRAIRAMGYDVVDRGRRTTVLHEKGELESSPLLQRVAF